MAVLLKQLIQQPTTSSKLLVCDPFRMTGKEELVKEVIGLANSDADGPRYILFGINPGAMEGNRIVGIDPATMSDLKKAHRYISELIQPVVALAFIYDDINGKIVGALEIDDCDEGPFVVGQDYSRELARGMAWKRDGRELLEVDIADLGKGPQHDSTAVIDESELIDPVVLPTIDVGFNDDPANTMIELEIPDASNPPFADEREDNRNLGQTIKDKVNTITSQVLNLARKTSSDSTESTDVVRAAENLFRNADNHYFYEEKAVKLGFSVLNTGTQALGDITIELGFPKVEGFDIAEQIYVSPFDKRSPAEIRNMGYPRVERRDKAIFVRNRIRELNANRPTPALNCPLRLAVGPAMRNKKLAILYTLRRNDQNIGQGRLKIQFGDVVA